MRSSKNTHKYLATYDHGTLDDYSRYDKINCYSNSVQDDKNEA